MTFEKLSIQDIEFEPVEQIFTESFLEKAQKTPLDVESEKLHYEIMLIIMERIQKHKDHLAFDSIFNEIMKTYNTVLSIQEA